MEEGPKINLVKNLERKSLITGEEKEKSLEEKSCVQLKMNGHVKKKERRDEEERKKKREGFNVSRKGGGKLEWKVKK